MAIVPARKREPRAQCPYVVVTLQKSAGSFLAPNKLARSAPKRVAVRVNGGLVGKASGTKVSVTSSVKGLLVCRPSSLPIITGIGEGPAKAQDDVRASFSGCLARQKAVRRSRDRGCKGHRILRRVLVEGRHLGLSRAISFHEAVVTATLAASSRRESARSKEHARVGARRCPHPAKEGEATEVSEVGLQWAPWEENSHAPIRA